VIGHPLVGRWVVLEPLTSEHEQGLLAAAGEDRAAYDWTGVPGTAAEVTTFVADALRARDAGHHEPFAVRRAIDGAVVGSTRFLNIERWPSVRADGRPDSAEIGSTWYAASAQRTAVNTEAKLLLLTHAFEVWEVQRLQLKTDARNARSRAAIERLGARFEGVLRHYQPGLGRLGSATAVRDTAMYSIVPDEWPAVKERLLAGLRDGSLSQIDGLQRQDR
jgi:RimJ/RimL family protein N-acetyltransferase